MARVAVRDERRAEVVASAMRVLASQGPEGLSMRKIAAEAGCTIGLINHWFDSKDDVIEAVLAQASTAAVSRSLDAYDEPDVTLERVVSEFLPLDGERVEELKIWLVFWALSIARPGLRDGYVRRVSAIRAGVVRELTGRGLVDDVDDVSRFVDLLMATVDGIGVNALTDPEYWTVERQLETLRLLLTQTEPR